MPVKNDEEEAFKQQIRDGGKDTLVVGHLTFMTKLVARLKYPAHWNDRVPAVPTSRDNSARHCCRAMAGSSSVSRSVGFVAKAFFGSLFTNGAVDLFIQ